MHLLHTIPMERNHQNLGIYEVNFGYNAKMEVYANSSLDISELSEIVDEW